ncbi:MAG: uracil-DNA glycosylase family protein [Pseudomonadota bacterium]
MSAAKLKALMGHVEKCTLCAKYLPFEPRPVFRPSRTAKILIVGQAPGTKVHNTGIPWNDPSGDKLREWMEIDRETFYDNKRIAIMPTAFCYPGRGKSGDLPPRPECAPTWHPSLLKLMPQIELTLLIGRYAQNYYLKENKKKTLTETVKAWKQYAPIYLPMPHPSPRNKLWLKKNDWFEKDIVPMLKVNVKKLLT